MIRLRLKAALLILVFLLGLVFFPVVFALLSFFKYLAHIIQAIYLCLFVIAKGRMINKSDKKQYEIAKKLKESVK